MDWYSTGGFEKGLGPFEMGWLAAVKCWEARSEKKKKSIGGRSHVQLNFMVFAWFFLLGFFHSFLMYLCLLRSHCVAIQLINW